MTAALKLPGATTAMNKNAEERRLLIQCREGDDGAMRELYKRHSGRIYSLSMRLLGNRADADEVVQECFLKAWRNVGSFRGDASVGTWLYRIALNLCRDRFRKRKPEDEQTDVAEVRDSYRDTFAQDRIENALGKLPPRYREILVMHDVLEMRHREIADVLGIAVGTSKSQLHKSRNHMRKLLVKKGIKTSV